MKFLATLGVWLVFTFTISGAIQFITHLLIIDDIKYWGIFTLSAFVSLLLTVNTEIKLYDE